MDTFAACLTEPGACAEIDGAGGWSRFRNVTLPMISPTILFNLVLGVIGAWLARAKPF